MKKINHTAKYTIKPKLTHSVAYQRGFGLSAEMKESHHAAVLDSQQRSAASSQSDQTMCLTCTLTSALIDP